MENPKTFGPFTPQEFKQASLWLSEKNIEFTHFRDEETEKRFVENSPENLVHQVELRTQTYLGSVFYIKAEMDSATEKSFKDFTHLTEDNIPERFKIPQIPETIDLEATKNKKNKWARILLIMLLAYSAFRLLNKYNPN